MIYPLDRSQAKLHPQPPAHDLVGIALVELATLGEGADPEEEDGKHRKTGDGGEDDKRVGKHGGTPLSLI
jgi:hypothetical protein